MFSRQKYTHSPCDIITLSIRVYFQMSGTCPEECHTTSGRILDEEARVGLTTQAILRLLIKTRQCCQPLDSNRMFSSRCRWRLLQENCWTNHKQLPFLFSRRMRQIDFLPIMCVHCDIFCFLQLYVSILMCLSCHHGHWRWWRLSWVHNEALYIHWNHFHVRRAPNFQEIPIMPDNTITDLE